jgi:hypothetical protein
MEEQKFLTLECEFCENGKIEVVMHYFSTVLRMWSFKKLGIKTCPCCEGTKRFTLVKH